MSQYKPVTVEATRRICDEFDKDFVVIIASDEEHNRTHYSSYGKTALDKQLSAGLADYIATLLGHNRSNVEWYADWRTKSEAVRAEEVDRLLRLIESLLPFARNGGASDELAALATEATGRTLDS